MTTREERNTRNLAAYHRQMADPAFREAKAAKERARWVKGEGARRNALDRERTAEVQAYRSANPSPVKALTSEQEKARSRVAAKREWRRAHAAELNARRKAARLSNPEKYRQQEQASKRRKRALIQQLKETSLPASKLLQPKSQ